MGRVTSKLGRIVLYSVAAGVIFFALLTTVSQLLAPELNKHKAFFEKMAERFFGMPVQIESIQLRWQGIYPLLKANHVSIMTDQQQPWLTIQALQIGVNPLDSLMHRQLITHHLRIMGTTLNITQLPDNHFNINGQSFNVPEGQANGQMNHGGYWLSKLAAQPSLTFQNIQVNWEGANHLSLPVFIKQVELSNHWDDHLISGSLLLQKKDVTSIDFGLNFLGDVKQLKAGHALLYASVNNLALSQWNFHPVIYGYKLKEAQLNGSVWAKWEAGHCSLIQSVSKMTQLQFFSEKDQDTLHVEQLSGNFLWQPKENSWELSGDHVELITDNYVWPENAFDIEMGKQFQQAWVSHIDIGDVYRLLAGSSLASTHFFSRLKNMNPVGELNQLYFQHHGPIDRLQDYQFSTGIINFNLRRWNKIPGVSGFSGALQLTPQQGVLMINSRQTTFDFGPLFQNTLFFDQLGGAIRWHPNEDNSLEVTGSHLSAISPSLALYGDLGLLIPSDGKSPVISLLAGFDLDDSSQAYQYLPSGVLSKEAMVWLNKAFVEGSGGEGTVILQGAVNQFPFEHGEGTFIVDGIVHDTELHYADSWPNILNINASLVFSGRSMRCIADSGQMEQSKIRHAEAIIPYLGHGLHSPVLEVKGVAGGDAGNLLRFLKESPLIESAKEDISHLQMEGNSQLDLHLILPLTALDTSQVNGTIHFDHASLAIPNWNLALPHLTGDILFTEKSFSSNHLFANLFDAPTELQINTVHPSDTSQGSPFTRITLQGNLEMDRLKKYFHVTIQDVVTGQTSYQATVDLHTGKNDHQSNQLTVVSYLEGLHIDLPPPLDKPLSAVWPFKLQVSFGKGKDTLVNVLLDKVMSFYARLGLSDTGLKFRSGNLHLGDLNAKDLSAHGLLVDGYLPSFDWRAWRNRLEAISSEQSSVVPGLAIVPTMAQPSLALNAFLGLRNVLRKVAIRLGVLDVWGQHLTDTLLTLEPLANNGWRIGMDSLSNAGTIDLPNHFEKVGIIGTFKRLTWDPTSDETTIHVSPAQIPPLKIHLDQFQWGKRKLAGIDLNTRTGLNTLYLNSLTFRSPMLTGLLTGTWTQSVSGADSSSISGQLQSDDMGKLMKMLNLTPSVLPNKGNVNVNLSWKDPLYRFNLSHAQGGLSMQYGSGRIVSLGQSTSAMLNIGSILTSLSIGRLFQMNFNDFTGSGYSFNSMTGALHFNQGKISTDDVSFKGEVADISMKGSIDATKKSLFLIIEVIPHLTSSLPVIAAFALNPMAGAITWAAQKVVGKIFDKVVSYRYEITGPWDKPVSKEITTPLSVERQLGLIKQGVGTVYNTTTKFIPGIS